MARSEEATSLNIAILASGEVANQAIKMSQQVASKYPTEFVLDRERFLPHVTVYQAHFPVRNIPQIQEKLKVLTAGKSPFNISFGELAISLDTFLWWNCSGNGRLREFHDQVVRKLNPLREGLILPHLATVTGMTEEDKQDMQEFGALKIGPRFSPHITITRLSNSQDSANAVKSLDLYHRATLEAEELVLGYLGPNGTVNGIIETFKFG